MPEQMKILPLIAILMTGCYMGTPPPRPQIIHLMPGQKFVLRTLAGTVTVEGPATITVD